jgi:hypothetical protein
VIEDHHRGAPTVRKLHRTETVAGGVKPRRFHIEGKESIPWKAPFEVIERGGGGPAEVSHTQTDFPQSFFKVHFEWNIIPAKIFTWNLVMQAILGVTCTK